MMLEYRIKTKYINALCEVKKAEYTNGRIALQLISNGEPRCMATVNLPDVDCPEGHAFIKDYSENTGVLKELIRNNIVSEPLAYIEGQYVTMPLCKVLI